MRVDPLLSSGREKIKDLFKYTKFHNPYKVAAYQFNI